MGIRRKARECALQILYQRDITRQNSDEVEAGFELKYPVAVQSFAMELVNGTLGNLGEIDGSIAEASDNWDLSRMSFIDRNILRLAVFEIRFRDDIPFKVSINEAIELGKKFGSDQSGNFINGILDRIVVKPETQVQ
jgi:N utilization substance protein B